MSKTKNSKSQKFKTKPANQTIKKPGKKTVQRRKFYTNAKFWIIVGSVCVAVIVITVLALRIISNQKHSEAVADYKEAWGAYASAQDEFGYAFGSILGELGFSTDGSTVYSLSSSDQHDIAVQCARKVGVYNEIYNNSYAVEDKDIEDESTKDIQNAVKSLEEYTSKINNAKESVGDCREVGQAKIAEIDEAIAEKEAEEKTKAEEEAAKKRQQEEAQAVYNKNKLDYDKFTNQIYEGMSLSAMKDVYGGFDSQCKIASQSGGWVIYSCTSSSYSGYWAASFTFYNGILKSKAQTGLN